MEGIQLQTLNVGVSGEIILLQVKGYVDATTAPELHKEVKRLLNARKYYLIVDLSAVNYISSAGWGVFVGEIRGIRENGGDLKIVHMTPDVREVFEMLEFNRILASYDTIEEVLDDFDISLGYDLTRSVPQARESTEDFSFQPVLKSRPRPEVVAPTVEEADTQEVVAVPHTHREESPPEGYLPINEKIRKIVLENPDYGAWTIRKILNSGRFGYTKLNYFKIRITLRRLNLDTKKKRHRYYRSR